MANNITIRQLDNGVYDSLLPRTTASKSYLTNDTSALYNLQNGTAEQAIQAIMRVIALSGNVSMHITDASGNPVVGAIVNGLVGSPISDENGNVQGIYEYTPVNIVSPYVDLQDKSVDVKNYIGSINVLTVRLDTYAENTVRRYTDSRNVRFSKMVKTVDVCCVGGGAGGSGHSLVSSSYNFEPGGGGGGGGIVNSYGLAIESDTPYAITIGFGGSSGGLWGYGNDGGDTSFLNVVGPGGKKVTTYKSDSGTTYVIGGLPGVAGCGNGAGNYDVQSQNNTTVSEFNDGITFYSGGGGVGQWTSNPKENGGKPNGAYGAAALVDNTGTATSKNAGTAGIGGGGGGAAWSSTYDSEKTRTGNSSAGGSGLVAIRLHFS